MLNLFFNNCAFINSGCISTIPTLNIMTGILSSITIILPIRKFLSLSKFIEPEIEDIKVKIGEPAAKVMSNNNILLCSTSSNKQAIGIIKRKGTSGSKYFDPDVLYWDSDTSLE